MPYGKYAECPCCNKIAKGEADIEEDFGYRTMNNGKIIPQSYCRECRSAHCEAGNPKH
ncbi:hemagglutinin [Clostridium fungisolvens]|uniref:Uncharacterized protein n=1 Tax=Clostridium fungisolvens TaxID=1604897 RepID=A0A6V8SI23_9CLOT|nr:hemagglutinin [Clostridium fungisolvens]GFP76386.1 hypothetical protein bsdtw1_02488 [Clostridium fungisolvens]